ncbi:MAG: phosphomannose isomerase type II C-terminal cupin domain [Elusimicrobia bacterium]|nr:phosphomannose isomerase type II C-terminal cupin domain [Elusimicrobiota bacterium]
MRKKTGRRSLIRAAHARPWGRWLVIERGAGYQVKRIEVLPGRRLSLQKHRHRAEHWTVIQGIGQVVCGRRKFRLKANQSCFIPKGSLHRLGNPGSTKLILIEVQVGSYLGEDDIIRLADDYGRVNSGEQ